MDLTNEQWERLEPLIPPPKRKPAGPGRPPRDPRDVLNGILWAIGLAEGDATPLPDSAYDR